MSKFLVVICGLLCALEAFASTDGSAKLIRRHRNKRFVTSIGQDASFKMEGSEQEATNAMEDELDFDAMPEILQQDPDIPDPDDVPEFVVPEEESTTPSPEKTDASELQQQQIVNVKQPACTIHVGDSAGSSNKGLPNTPCSACSKTCTGENKQKALYVVVGYVPALTTLNAFSVQKNFFYRNFTRLALRGKNGIYDASPVGFGGSRLSGYFGSLMSGVKGGKLRLGLLFSIWDSQMKAVPASEPFGCRRNCNDCGGQRKDGRTTGTQCSAHLGDAAFVGENITLRLYRKTEVATATWNNKTYKGSEWEIAYLRGRQTNWTVFGRMLLESTTGGINRLGNFHEHVGCTPCDAFYEHTIISTNEILVPQNKHMIREATHSQGASCKLHRVIAIPNPSGRVPLISIETGPGVTRSFNQSVASLFTCP